MKALPVCLREHKVENQGLEPCLAECKSAVLPLTLISRGGATGIRIQIEFLPRIRVAIITMAPSGGGMSELNRLRQAYEAR